jgi:hypothetical protein
MIPMRQKKQDFNALIIIEELQKLVSSNPDGKISKKQLSQAIRKAELYHMGSVIVRADLFTLFPEYEYKNESQIIRHIDDDKVIFS